MFRDAPGSDRGRAPFGRGPHAARVLARVIDGAAAIGARLPVRVAGGLAVFGGHAEWALRPRKRRLLAVNISHALGVPDGSPLVRRLVRREVVNEARRSADLLWAIGRREEMIAGTEVIGLEHLEPCLAAGRGIVLAGLHLGGWEVVAAVPGAVLPVPTTVVVADNWLAWAMQHIRAAEGLHTLSRTAPAITAARLLRRGEAVLILGDDATDRLPREHRVQLGAGHALLPAGIVTLARLSGAAVVPFSVLPVGPRRWRVRLDPPIEPPGRGEPEAFEAVTLQLLADRWTALIRAHPDQWAASFPIAWDVTGG